MIFPEMIRPYTPDQNERMSPKKGTISEGKSSSNHHLYRDHRNVFGGVSGKMLSTGALSQLPRKTWRKKRNKDSIQGLLPTAVLQSGICLNQLITRRLFCWGVTTWVYSFSLEHLEKCKTWSMLYKFMFCLVLSFFPLSTIIRGKSENLSQHIHKHENCTSITSQKRGTELCWFCWNSSYPLVK